MPPITVFIAFTVLTRCISIYAIASILTANEEWQNVFWSGCVVIPCVVCAHCAVAVAQIKRITTENYYLIPKLQCVDLE